MVTKHFIEFYCHVFIYLAIICFYKSSMAYERVCGRWKIGCWILLYLQLFVGGVMSYLRYLCLLCCVFVLLVAVLCLVYLMMQVFLDCQFLIASLVFSNIYLLKYFGFKYIYRQIVNSDDQQIHKYEKSFLSSNHWTTKTHDICRWQLMSWLDKHKKVAGLHRLHGYHPSSLDNFSPNDNTDV